MEHIMIICSLPSAEYELLQTVEVIIENTVFPNKFTGRFKNLPLIMKAEGRTRIEVLRKLGQGLVLQYELVKNQPTEFHRLIKEAMETIMVPVKSPLPKH